MYCHNCGKELFGNYCSNCGAKAISAAPGSEGLDWRSERNFNLLMKHPEVRKLIAKYADQASEKMSAKEFLQLVDLLFIPLAGLSTEKISSKIVPLYKSLGISTGKTASRVFTQSIQESVVKSLCSLAKRGYPLESLDGASDGVILVAKIPSDMWTWGGKVVISIREEESVSEINIATKIGGQLYDWGKSKKLIEGFILDMEGMELA